MMKKILYVFLLFAIVACENPVIEKVESKYPNGEKNRVAYYQEKDGKEILVEEKHYHENGVLKMAGKFLNEKREGHWKAYFNNEQLQSIGEFKDGLRIGIVKVFYPGGQLRYEGQYENDKQVGHWKFYNERGELVKEEDF
ncbi:MAG: toxin-antitoxin system YwqK family antitoxin [Vicingaceae bacterium]